MSKLNIDKLKAYNSKLEGGSLKELQYEIDEHIIQLTKDKNLRQELLETKNRYDFEASSRTLNHWESIGIVDPGSEVKNSWRRHSVIEALWIDTIIELRKFGVSLEAIKGIKDKLFESGIGDFMPLYYYTLFSIVKEPVVFVILASGSFGIMPISVYQKRLGKSVDMPHIHINFHYILKGHFKNNAFAQDFSFGPKIKDLNEKEIRLLYYIRTGNYDSIKVKMKEGEMYLIEGTAKRSPSTKIIDIIRNSKYQNIEIKVEDSKTVHIQTTEKLKP